MNKSFFKRNPTLFIAVCAALFIPLIIAVVFAFRVNPYSVTENNLNEISIRRPDGKEYTFNSKEIRSLYASMTNGATEVDSSFDSFDDRECYEITFFEENSEPLVYEFYPSSNLEDCVCVSPDGKYYIVDKSIAEKIVTREEFSLVDTENLLPELTVSALGGDTAVKPDSYEWTYTALDGSDTVQKGEENADNPVIKFDDSAEGKLSLQFSKQPDSVTVTITKSGNVVFDDKYENLSAATNLHFEKDTMLSLSAVAEWYKLEDSKYYGKAEYSFDLLYDIAPDYKILDPSLPTGEFTVLSMSNFNDGEMLGVEGDLGLGSSIPVYDYKNTKITLIPLTYSLDAGDHVLNLSTEAGHKTSVKVGVSRKENYKKQTLIIDETREESESGGLSSSFSQESLDEFDALIKKYSLESANEQLFEGKKFDYPTGSNKLTAGGAEYGMTRDVMSISAARLSYTSMGQDMACEKGQNIKPANTGKVVYAAETKLLGNTVIVDHGFGILTCYGNLDSISVKEGDSVTKGETVLGKAGSTGFACSLAADGATVERSARCHYAVSLNGVFISPRSIFNGIYLD